MRKALLLLVVLAGFATGCDRKEGEHVPIEMGYDYYPLEIGAYRIYDVTDIKFLHNVGDTSHFQVKELVDTIFYDQTNTLNYKIRRSIRPDASSRWQDDSVIVVAKLHNMVLLTQDNTKYVKLVFPVKEGKTWVGDAYNDHRVDGQKESYSYANVGESYTVKGQTFSNTTTVVQGSPVKDGLRLDDRKEIYAEEVGRVYRLFKRVVLAPCSPGQCEYGDGYKLDGHERHEELIAYGKE